MSAFDSSNAESRSWYLRSVKASNIFNSLEYDKKFELSAKIVEILCNYFLSFPVVNDYLENGEIVEETYHFIVPVLEDVLKEEGLFDED